LVVALPSILEADAPGGEALLLLLLGKGGLANDQKAAVIIKLGQVGTVASIPELRTHCDEFFDPTAPKAAAKAAIAAIQARVPGAEVGQLTVVGEDAKRGGLSRSDE
jgi:hypothetical protein